MESSPHKMFDLSDVLSRMGLSHECRGEVRFSALGLASSDPGMPMLTFLESAKWLEDLSDAAACVIAPTALSEEVFSRGLGLCICDEPRSLFFAIHRFLSADPGYVRPIHKTIIGKDCSISPLAFVPSEGVVIGDRCVVEEFASIKAGSILQDDCVVRTGSVIGGEGFEVKRYGDRLMTVPHLGGVILKNGVEIQQNACIDKAVYPWDDTVIGPYSRIDNLVHVAHGVHTGSRVEAAALSCIAGRVCVDDDAWIGPGAVIRNGITIGKRARVNMGSVVTQSVSDGCAVSGNFAIDHERFIRNQKHFASGLFGSE